MDITGASAIVTGGASGIGAAVARLLAERGAQVVVATVQLDDHAPTTNDDDGPTFDVQPGRCQFSASPTLKPTAG